MKAFFANVWTKRFVSLIAAVYTFGVCTLCYYSIFFNIHVSSRTSLCLIVSAVSLIALILMLYTRKQLVTRLSSFIILTAMLPVVLLYFDEKEILIPIVATGVIILLLSGAGEGIKTVVGTMILLAYIFGALGYFLFTSFFVTTSKTTVVESGVSPTGRYRYQIVNTEDSSNGSTAVIIEPNYADKEYDFVTFTLKNMEHTVYQERPMCESVNIEWSQKTRQEITEDLNKLSDDIDIALSDEELRQFGITPDNCLQLANIDIYERFAIGKTAVDVDPIKLDTLTDDQLARFDIGREGTGRYYVLKPTEDLLMEVQKQATERVYLAELSPKAVDIFNGSHLDSMGYWLFELESDNNVKLRDLDDAKLAAMGISPSGDILTFNGKVCFRYYVAEIRDYFDVDSRKFSIDLLNS